MAAKAAPAFVGVLMLDTRFPRPPGDIGCPQTFARAGVPVRFVTVQGASPVRVVQQGDASLIQPFVDAARALVREGAALITTSCGFLASFQQALAAAVPVPVVTSSLLQVRDLSHPGIVTFDAAALGPQVLRAAGVPQGTPVQGVRPGCEFHRRILDNDTTLDFSEAARNVVEAAERLVQLHPQVKALVLECTNMPPYRDAVARATGRPVHDIETLVLARWAAL
jgi:hypothetical protein